jgi:hypothetical protein
MTDRDRIDHARYLTLRALDTLGDLKPPPSQQEQLRDVWCSLEFILETLGEVAGRKPKEGIQ